MKLKPDTFVTHHGDSTLFTVSNRPEVYKVSGIKMSFLLVLAQDISPKEILQKVSHQYPNLSSKELKDNLDQFLSWLLALEMLDCTAVEAEKILASKANVLPPGVSLVQVPTGLEAYADSGLHSTSGGRKPYYLS